MKPSADQAMAAAKAWLAAVHDKDAGKLAAAVDFPYWQAGMALGKTGADTCQKRVAAATANDLAPVAKCLAEDTNLIDLIPSGGTTQEIAPNDVHDALKAYKQSLSDAESTHRFIQVELEQDYHMVLVIAVHQANGKALVDFVVGELVG